MHKCRLCTDVDIHKCRYTPIEIYTNVDIHRHRYTQMYIYTHTCRYAQM